MSKTAHHIGPDSAPDRYRLLRSIGRGGEAVLYLAEIELAGGVEPVVVKVLDSKTTITPEAFERISRKWNEQAELLRFVHRPGVVGVREHFQGPPIHPAGAGGPDGGRALVLVMNHVDGLDLRDWRAERTLGTHAERREVMRTLEQLADVLDWLHSGKATPSGRTVVHGDLSPGNVMVDEHGQATLVDFGLSKLTADHQTAEVWFTPGYAAPEVFEGKRTPATDRYAFGALAYFLLSGETPPTAPGQLAAALGALPQIAALTDERRQRVLAVADADPERRPPNLSAWVRDVRHGVVSTTASHPATVQDAAPAAPVVGAAVAAPPVDARSLPPRPAAAPAAGHQGFGPPVPPPPSGAQPGTVPPPAAAGARRRKGPVLAAVAGVVLVAVLAVAGVQLLGDKEKADKGAGSPGGAASSAPPSPTTPSPTATTESPTPTPTPTVEPSSEEPSGTPSEEPSSGTPSADDPVPVGAGTADLTGFTPVVGRNLFKVTSAKINAVQYGTAFVSSCYSARSVEFDLNKEWSTLKFTAGVDDSSPKKSSRVSVSVDGGSPLFSEAVELGRPVTRALDVKGALRLTLTVHGGCGSGGVVAIAEPTLER
ncbi:protein kinase domain-containing protein [Streptomyces cinereoruber]